ncbi:RNA polymerase sigma-I factor [Anaerobacillus sp. MEB173]|uniref:RNA polymerase sigma-I factor n=1 Tax=Anaerobacillus sp. MEB173 TaxID=3383345 RepID=UPI003F8F4AE2
MSERIDATLVTWYDPLHTKSTARNVLRCITMEMYSKLPKSILQSNQLEERVAKIQSGDERLRTKVLEQYQPFIKKITSKVCKKYIDQNMDEYSEALYAFNIAIDKYNHNVGVRFLSFASVVIRQKVIDYIRKETRQVKVTFFDQRDKMDVNDGEPSFIEQQISIEKYEQQIQNEQLAHEIEEYSKLLNDYGITFQTLTKKCPKHKDAIRNMKNITSLIVEDPELSRILLEKKQLPINDLLKHASCSRKTIERNRKYIIALALISLGGFQQLKSYIN